MRSMEVVQFCQLSRLVSNSVNFHTNLSRLSSRKQFPDQVRDIFRMMPQQSMMCGVVSIFPRGTGFALHTVQIVVKSTFNRAQKIIRATRLPVKGQNHCCALLPFNEKTLFRKYSWKSFIRPQAIFCVHKHFAWTAPAPFLAKETMA